MVDNEQALYPQVVEIASDYLGPTSERFIDRQIVNHLGKDPKELDYKDLAELIDWIKVVVALLTDDKHLVQEFTDRLKLLAKQSSTA